MADGRREEGAEIRRSGRKVGRLADHPVVEAGARAGYIVNGVLNILIAWLALQVAFGNRGAEADPSGAMELVAGTPSGWVLLVVVIVAFGLLALSQLAESLRAEGAVATAKPVAKAVLYVSLGLGAVSFLLGVGTSGAAQARDITAKLMNLPFGVMLVVIVGVAVFAVGVYHLFVGWTERFRKDLTKDPGPLVMTLGRIGYIARGIALVAVGVGLATAGLRHQPSKSRGLDGALNDLVRLPMGQALVVVVALGFAAYGLYSFARARFSR